METELVAHLPPAARHRIADLEAAFRAGNAGTARLLERENEIDRELDRTRQLFAARFKHKASMTPQAVLEADLSRPLEDGVAVGLARSIFDLEAGLKRAQADRLRHENSILPIGRLLSRAKAYARATQGRQIEPAPAIDPGVTARNAAGLIEKLRAQIAATALDIRVTANAPRPSAVAKARGRAEIDALAARGKVDAGGLVDAGGPILWPNRIDPEFAIAEVDRIGLDGRDRVDCLALIVWLHKDALLAALDREIEECADDETALTDEEREARLKELRSELFARETAEAAAIRAAEGFGIDVDQRPDCDIRAFLGLAENAPPAPEIF